MTNLKNREYFDANVNMSVELEYEMGGRNWFTMKGSEVKEFCDRHSDEISDIDFACKQDNAWVKKVLNTAYYNWSKNMPWVRKQNITSLWALVDFIIDNNLVA